jgi:hypothetical protein
MKNAIGVVVTAGLVIGVCTPAKAQNLEGTLPHRPLRRRSCKR